MASLVSNFPHKEHGNVDILSVEGGKYGFVVNDQGQVVEFLRYGEKWNNEEVYMIKYNRAITALVHETIDRIKS